MGGGEKCGVRIIMNPHLLSVPGQTLYQQLHLQADLHIPAEMKVTFKEWNAVATWRWDMPDDDVCGICRVQFDGTCPTCKFPGDDCALCT